MKHTKMVMPNQRQLKCLLNNAWTNDKGIKKKILDAFVEILTHRHDVFLLFNEL